jgi:hypothetical protein
MYPNTSSARIPQTMWWMCRPPLVSTFPGHQLTWALIMWVLVRMKPKATRKAQMQRNWGSRPVSTIPSR